MAFNLPVFEQIMNAVAIKTKEVNRMQLAGNETELSNNCNELLHQWPSLLSGVAQAFP